jgi:hypothetical protein
MYKTLSLFSLIVLLFAAPAIAIDAKQVNKVPHCTVASLSACAGEAQGRMAWVIDGLTGTDCAAGGGTYQHLCIRNESGAWETAIASSGDLSYTPDDVDQWITTPTTVDEAIEDLLDHEMVLNVLAFGAVANAVAATCTGAIPPVCSDLGSGTDSSQAFADAIDVLGAAGGGTLFVPAGNYRAKFLLDEDYVTIKLDPGAVIMPPLTMNDGGYLIDVCGEAACDGTTPVLNPVITGGTLHDDYPERTGNTYYIAGVTSFDAVTPTGAGAVTDYSGTVAGTIALADVAYGLTDGDWVKLSNCTESGHDGYYQSHQINADSFYVYATYAGAGTCDWDNRPGPGDTVKWDVAGASQGKVIHYDDTLSLVRIDFTSGTAIADGELDLYRTNRWHIDDVSLTCANCDDGDDTAESSGIRMIRVTNPIVAGVSFDSLGYRGIELHAADTTNTTANADIYGNNFTSTPSLSSGGSAISVGYTDSAHVHGNWVDGGVYGSSETNAMLEVLGGAAALNVSDNWLIDDTAITPTPYGQVVAALIVDCTNDALVSPLISRNVIRSSGASIFVTNNTNAVTGAQILDNVLRRLSLSTNISNEWLVKGGTIDCNSEDQRAFGALRFDKLFISDVKVQNCNLGIIQSTCSGGTPCGALSLRGVTATSVGSSATSSAALIHLTQANSISDVLEVVDTRIWADASAAGVADIIDCQGSTNGSIVNSYLYDADSHAVRDCLEVVGGAIDNSTADGVNITSVLNHRIEGVRFSNIGDDCIEIAGDSSNGSVSNNIFVDCVGSAVDMTAGTTDYMRVLGNIAVDGSDLDVLTGAEDECKATGVGTAANSVCANNIDK